MPDPRVAYAVPLGSPQTWDLSLRVFRRGERVRSSYLSVMASYVRSIPTYSGLLRLAYQGI